MSTLTQIYKQRSGVKKTPWTKRRNSRKRDKSKPKATMKDYFKVDGRFIKSKKINKVIIHTNKKQPHCKCGIMLFKTSKTEKNWNRKYWTCPNYFNKKVTQCKAFIWDNKFIKAKRKLKQTVSLKK